MTRSWPSVSDATVQGMSQPNTTSTPRSMARRTTSAGVPWVSAVGVKQSGMPAPRHALELGIADQVAVDHQQVRPEQARGRELVDGACLVDMDAAWRLEIAREGELLPPGPVRRSNSTPKPMVVRLLGSWNSS